MNTFLNCKHRHCGSGLAREDGVSVNIIIGCETAFASKPAPTLTAVDLGERRG